MKGSSQHRRLFLLLRLRYRIVGSEAASYINKGGGGGSIAFGYMEDIISTGGKGRRKTVSEEEGEGESFANPISRFPNYKKMEKLEEITKL